MSAASFSTHRDWILELREAAPAKRARHGSLADDLVMQLAGDDPLSPSRGDSSSPSGYYSMAQMGSIGFDSLVLEDDIEVYDDEPVYRSLGLFGGDAGDEVYDDEPVYRSLGGADAGADADVAEEQWLASMPPLVCRQSEFLDLTP